MTVDTTVPAAARRGPGTDLICLAAAGLLWGTGGLTGSLLSRTAGLPPLSVAAYRLAAGGALIVAVLTLAGRRWPAGRAAWARITAIGLLAATFQSCYFLAVSLTSVSLATLVTIGSSPVLVLAAERVLWRRRAGRRASLATGLALAGLGLLVGGPAGGVPEAVVAASAGLAVLAAAGFAALTLISARPVAGLDELTATGFGFTAGGLVLLPLAAALGRVTFPAHPASLGLLALLGTGPTAVAYTLYFRGLRTARASLGALLSLLEPLTGTILAWLVLGDRLGASGIVGAGILAAALILAATAGSQPTTARPPAGRAGASGDGPAHDTGGPGQHDRERQRDAERSRAALLAAAPDEVAERGFAGARVADIARRAGLNKQLINYYFGSKEGLYLALQQSWLDREESFADPGLPLADLVVRYLEDALQDPRPMRLLLWRGFTDDSAPEGEHDRQPDVDRARARARQQTGEVAADLDPAAVLLAGMGMVAAPLIMPQVARELLGTDPYSPEFGTRYAEQLRRIIAHLAAARPAPEDTR